jgi:hypothetical protein
VPPAADVAVDADPVPEEVVEDPAVDAVAAVPAALDELVDAAAPALELLAGVAPGTRPSCPSALKMLSMNPSMPPPRSPSPSS